jgi:hypothetical protein
MSRLLERLGISYKRGRDYIHSPDRYYQQKLSVIELALLRAMYDPEHYVLLYQDEFTFYRQPTLSREYEACGVDEPRARRSTRSNTSYRIVGAINALSGEVLVQQQSKIGLRQLVRFYQALAERYKDATEIMIVQDNWPIHLHPDVLAHLNAQEFAFPVVLPANWPAESRLKIDGARLPIRLVLLPTYASWLNPIEKLWRWLKQDVLHLHRLSDDWTKLQLLISEFLEQFDKPNDQLLRYVGLLPP